MALGRYKTFVDGNTLPASDLNSLQDHYSNNALTLISPLTGTLDANNNQISNLKLETRTASPSTGNEGRIYYHTSRDQIEADDGSNIRVVPTIASVTAGDLIYASTASQWARLGIGSSNQVLVVSAGAPAWSSTITGVTLTSSTASLSSLTVGSGSAMAKYVSATASVASAAYSSSTISANTAATFTMSVSGVAVGDAVAVSPDGDPGSGLVWSAYVSATDVVTVKVGNVTATAVVPTTRVWRVGVFR